jgi:hypothetical protein
VPAQTAPRRPRPPTRGILLDKMTRAMMKKLPISVADGCKRPHDPVQAAKFASEASVVVRDSVPILTHWKQYKKDQNILDGFVGRLSLSSSILCLHLSLYQNLFTIFKCIREL